MAKKLNNNIYLNQDEPENRRILLDIQDTPRKNLRGEPDEYREKPPLWNFLRPIVITVISLAMVCGFLFYGYNYVKDKYFSPVDASDNKPI
ncbi:MAG: hypothetical protein WCP73_05385, partial [Eubacteriales bacterium]